MRKLLEFILDHILGVIISILMYSVLIVFSLFKEPRKVATDIYSILKKDFKLHKN